MSPDILKQNKRHILDVLSALSYRSHDLQGYLQDVAQGLSQLVELDWSIVTLCEGDAEQLLASSIDLGSAQDQIYSLHGTLTEQVVCSGRPLSVEDVTACPQYTQVPDGYRAYLGVPLRLPSGEVVGTICSFQRQPRSFTPEETQVAQLFAERAAIAIDNYQLFQKQQQFNQALEEKVEQRTAELQAMQDQLIAMNNQLESRVEQRTTELQQANDQLQAEVRDRKQVEANLRASEGRFRTLVEQATDAFFVINAAGQVVDVNQFACDSLGYTRSELLSLTVPQIQVQLTPAEILDIRQEVEKGQPITREGLHRRKDGTVFPVEVRVGMLKAGEESLHLALVRDITERKQAAKALERLAEVGELAAMIVHEVRNPLATVLMGLNAFQKLELSERFQTRLDLALEEAARLKRLLNEILLYARPQTLQKGEIDLNQLLQDLHQTILTLPSAAARQIELTPASESTYVLGDADKLKQVFLNLVCNACEAVSSGETVTWQVVKSPANNHISIQICNGGPPIPPDILPKLTQPFFTTKSTGNGLGLAITQRIVEAHGGTLRIQSSADQGTIARVDLPCHSPN